MAIPPVKPAWAMPDDPAAEALLKAAFDGSLDDLKVALAKGTPVEAKSERGFTALNLAAVGNHPEAVKILIAAKANVNAKDNNGHTPLQGCSRSETKEGRVCGGISSNLEAYKKASSANSFGEDVFIGTVNFGSKVTDILPYTAAGARCRPFP